MVYQWEPECYGNGEYGEQTNLAGVEVEEK